MSLKTFWANYHRYGNDFCIQDAHLIVEHRDYLFPVLACTIWPFVASEVTGARIQRNRKVPTCERCCRHLNWLATHMVLDELKEKARLAGVLGK